MNDLEARLLDAVRDVLDGSEYAPADDSTPSMISEMCIVVGWVDAEGENATSHIRIGSSWATYGLMLDAVDGMRQKIEQENRPAED